MFCSTDYGPKKLWKTLQKQLCVNARNEIHTHLLIISEIHAKCFFEVSESSLYHKLDYYMDSSSMMHTLQFKLLFLNNCDTWSIEAEALIVKNETWSYIMGKIPILENKVISTSLLKLPQNKIQRMAKRRPQSKSRLILSIGPAQLKQIKGCNEIWKKFDSIYAYPQTSLIYAYPQKSLDFCNIKWWTETVYKITLTNFLTNVQLDNDWLSIILLFSLPSSFENFSCHRILWWVAKY